MSRIHRSFLTFSKWFDSRHIVLKAFILTLLLDGFTWILPGALFRGALIRSATSYQVEPAGFTFGSSIITTGIAILFIFPVFTVWFWLPKASHRLEDQLEDILPTGQVQALDINRPWHVPVAVASSVIYVSYFTLAHLGDEFHLITVFEAIGWWGWFFPIISIGIPAFLFVMCLIRYGHLIRWLVKQLKQGVKVNPLAQDECGGLGFIGSMLQRLTLFSVTIGLWLIWQQWSANMWERYTASLLEVIFWPGIIIYLLLLFYLVIYPTWFVHQKMVKTRDTLLQDRSKYFKNAVLKDGFNNEQNLILLQKFRTEYKTIREAYPIWPFTIQNWRILRFFSTLPPIIGIALSIVQFLN